MSVKQMKGGELQMSQSAMESVLLGLSSRCLGVFSYFHRPLPEADSTTRISSRHSSLFHYSWLRLFVIMLRHCSIVITGAFCDLFLEMF